MTSYCGHCGQPAGAPGQVGGTVAGTVAGHEACAARLALEPPRYCPRCRRRMVVQVLPDGWTARCAEHGETVRRTWADPRP